MKHAVDPMFGSSTLLHIHHGASHGFWGVICGLKKTKMNSYVTFSYGPFHTDEQVFDDPLEFIYNSSVRTQDEVLKICRKR